MKTQELKQFDPRRPFVQVFGEHSVLVDGVERHVGFRQGNVLYDHARQPLCTDGPPPKLTAEQAEAVKESEDAMRERIRAEVEAGNDAKIKAAVAAALEEQGGKKAKAKKTDALNTAQG